jgi:hypothetical protein
MSDETESQPHANHSDAISSCCLVLWHWRKHRSIIRIMSVRKRIIIVLKREGVKKMVCMTI